MEHLGDLLTECVSTKETQGQREEDCKWPCQKRANTLNTWKKKKGRGEHCTPNRIKDKGKENIEHNFTVKQLRNC